MWLICEKMFIFAPVVPPKVQQTWGELLNRSWITTLMLEWAKCQNPLSVGVPDSMAQQFPVRFCAMWWGRGRVVEICTFSISMKIRKGFLPIEMENRTCVAIILKRMCGDSGCMVIDIRRSGHLALLQPCCAYRPVGPSSRRNETKFSKQSALAVDKHLRDNQHQSTGRSR